MLPLAPTDTPHLAPRAAAAALAHGVQTPAVRRGGAADHPAAHVCLAAVRLQAVGTDLLVTLNVPLSAAGGSPAAPLATLRGVLRSLRVVDWSLFGHGVGAAAT